MKKTYVIIMLALFAILSAVFYMLKTSAPAFRFPVLMGGNVIMLTLSIVTYFIALQNIAARPQAFVRGVYSASFLKLFACMIGIVLYVVLNKPDLHKPTLFVLFGIYFVYSMVETILLSKIARTTK